MKQRLTLALVAAGLLTAGGVLAQQSVDGPFILHEYFEAEGSTGGEASGDAEGAASTAPTHEPGQPPALSMDRRPDEPIYGADGPISEEEVEAPYGELNPFSSANRLDQNTDRVDSLTYFAAFEPSVIPYKRVVSQDRVVAPETGMYAIEVDEGDRRRVRPASRQPAGTETFWGTFLLRTRAEQWQPIASISPSQTILEVRTEPEVDVKFYRDSAGNHFVRVPRGGLIRLNVKLAVPTFYFQGEFGEDVEWSDFPEDLLPGLPGGARVQGRQVLRQLGVTQDRLSPADAVIRLVEYFRNFDARPFPDALRGEDLYRAITLNQVGVCRHRSLAFVISAQYLGIPAHYVYNEAHAFVEIYWPGSGWRRIDLGGAADELNAAANQGTDVHETRDTLPQPERFREEQRRMQQNGWDSGDGEDGDGDGSDNADSTNPRDGEKGAESADEQASPEMMEALEEAAEDVDGDAEATEGQDPRPKPNLRIVSATSSVKRGSELRVRARLTDPQGTPLNGRLLQFFLGPIGSNSPRSATLLGQAETNRRGEATSSLKVPDNQGIGRWSLFVVFPGDETHRRVVVE